MSSGERSHYQAMGLAPAAGPDEVRQAYLRLARTLHPDRFMDASTAERGLAERRMREVNAAWAVLGDPARRRDYDRELAAARAAAGASTGRSSRPAEPSPGPAPDDDAADPEYLEWSHDLDDDDVELSRPVAFLLRRGPIIVILAVFLGLFVGTALADGRRDEERIRQQQMEQEQFEQDSTSTTVCDGTGACG